MKPQFKLFNYNINGNIGPKDIELAINIFYQENITNFKNNRKFAILFKIKTTNNYLMDISPLQIIDKTGLEKLNIIFKEYLLYKINTKLIVNKIIFIFILIEDNIAPSTCLFNPITVL